MKNKNLAYVSLILLTGLLVGYAIVLSKAEEPGTQTDGFGYGRNIGSGQGGQPTRDNCLADDCLLVEDLEYPAGDLPVDVQEALNEAINDEYKALTVYEGVVAELGMVRPFSMIMGAEEQHIASLKAVYDKYGLEIPANTLGKISSPTILQEACQVGVDAEIANAALYKEELLPAVQEYEDIVTVFTNLMNASEQKHLPAFEKCN